MMSCCSMCYAHYINEDGTLNQEAFETERIKYLEQPKKRKDQRSPEEQAKLEDRLPTWPPGCKCQCHVIGSAVLH